MMRSFASGRGVAPQAPRNSLVLEAPIGDRRPLVPAVLAPSADIKLEASLDTALPVAVRADVSAGSFRAEGVHSVGGVALHLHGAVDLGAEARLGLLLESLLALQPLRLLVDLSEAKALSEGALELIERCGQIVDGPRLSISR